MSSFFKKLSGPALAFAAIASTACQERTKQPDPTYNVVCYAGEKVIFEDSKALDVRSYDNAVRIWTNKDPSGSKTIYGAAVCTADRNP